MAEFTNTVAADKLVEFRAAFLRAKSAPPEWEGTVDEWITEWSRQQLHRAYAAGRRQLHEDTGSATINRDIIT